MPRTLAQNAQYIANTIKPAIKSAIEAQGVTVPSTDSFLDYADRIGEIEGGGSGYQLKDLPTGSISTVTDAAELPLNALKVSVEAWQEGSGDPSPSNVRPIHGWSSGQVFDRGKNLLRNEKYRYNSYNVFIGGVNSSNIEYFLKAGNYTITVNFAEGIAANYKRINYAIRGGTVVTLAWGVTSATITLSYSGYYQFWINASTSIDVSDIDNFQLELGTTATAYEPYQGKQYTQQFPQTIYGAEWDVVNGGMQQTDDGIVFDGSSSDGWSQAGNYGDVSRFDCTKTVGLAKIGGLICSNLFPTGTAGTANTELIALHGVNGRIVLQIKTSRLQSDDVSGLMAWFAINNLQVKYELATPTTINLSPLSIRMLQGTNNIYVDCGEVIEGEYFVDEGAIDVRKVDYQIGASGSIKTTDGRVLSGFASMSGYHARPLDASRNWLDVDWSKDFEIGVAFKFTALPNYQGITGDGNANSYRKAPRIYYDNSEGKLALCVSSDGSTLAIDQYLNYSFVVDKWYFIKVKFALSTMAFSVDISDDFDAFTNLYTGTMSNAPYHNAASLCFGGDAQQSNMASNTFLVDTFNTYIKGDGVSWGAFTGVFPS